MNKKELLDILYAERARIMTEYTAPGWTKWAIIAASASIVWIILGYLEIYEFCWENVCLIFFTIETGLILITVPKAVSYKSNRPIWGKSGKNARHDSIVAFIFFIGEIIFFFQSSCIHMNFLAVLSIIFLLILVLVYLGNIVLSFVPTVITTRFNRFLWIWYIILSPMVYILVTAIISSYHYIFWCELKMALLLTVLWHLISVLTVDTKNKLESIDNLIEETILSNKIEDEYVLNKLDECVRGLRMGDFLYEDNAKYLLNQRSYLVNNLCELFEALNRNDHKKEELLIKDSIQKVSNLSNVLQNIVKLINLSYGKKMQTSDTGLQMTITLIDDCLEICDDWQEISTMERNIGDYSEYLHTIVEKYFKKV